MTPILNSSTKLISCSSCPLHLAPGTAAMNPYTCADCSVLKYMYLYCIATVKLWCRWKVRWGIWTLKCKLESLSRQALSLCQFKFKMFMFDGDVPLNPYFLEMWPTWSEKWMGMYYMCSIFQQKDWLLYLKWSSF